MAKKEVFNLTIDVGANIQQAKNAAESLRQAFAKVNLSDSLKGSLDKTFANLEKEITNFEGLANKPFKNMSDIQKAEKSYGKIVDLFSSLEVTAKNVQGFDLEKLIPKDTIKKLNELETGWKDLADQVEKNKKAITKTITAENNLIEEQRKKIDDLRKAKGELNKENQKLGRERGTINNQLKSRDQSRNELVQEREALKKERDSIKDRTSEQYADLDTKYNKASQAVRDFDKDTKKLNASSSELSQKIEDNRKKITQYDTDIKNAGTTISESTKKIEELTNAAKTPEGLDNLRQAIADLTNSNIDDIPTDLEQIRQKLSDMKAEEVAKVGMYIKEIGAAAQESKKPMDGIKKAVDGVNESGEKLNETAAEVERLGDQIRQFFSIGNTINLFKRAVRDAMNTIKELDATMTETATVTDFSINDMWQQLPRYTDEANKLGTSINSLYKATTLYYQQGLQTNEAMALGIETIKMARVASMDAAQATDLMTAALRGFNMELNETSAIRINDVYSELAAVTAADTDEIGIAISKTASIAHSANMEFETTAAFLSQIIETTREAPETAGTAMKTIVARFSEVKKLYSEGQITGTDEEGEVVNVNKIQEALRTVGIDMTKFFTGKEGLDQVLLRLAEKWDTLDVVTQRYIATQAAGSRQQSRFLAMMSDYDRTLELVDAAYNSAGSGQAQFEKTLDSVQAKLSELKNAWDQFTMGIANDTLIKAGIDTLTKILSTINDIISAISGNNGLIKSIVSIGASFLALRGGAKLFKGGFIGKIFGALKGKDVKDQAKKTGTEIGAQVGENIAEGIFFTKERIKDKFTSFFSKENFGIGIKGTEKLEKINYKKIDRDKFEDIIANNAAGLGGTLTTDQIQVARVEFETNGAEAGIKALQDFGAEIKVTKQGIQDWNKAATAVGQTIIGVGAAITAFGALVSKSNEEAGESIAKFGTLITTLGGVISVIPGVVSGIKAISSALSVSGGVVGVVIAAISALIGLFVLLANSTPEKKLERAQKKAEESAKAAQEAQQAYDDLLSNKNNYNELEEKVASLTKGTQEWKDAVAELNSKVLELVQNYEGLELQYDSEGNLTIFKESWDKVESESKNKVDKATAQALSDQIGVAQAQIKVAKSKGSAVTASGEVLEDWQLRNLRGEMGNISDDEWEEYLKSQEIKYTPTIDLSDAEKQLETARKNLILAFMPESVDKKEANQVGKALTTLIGEAIDEETDPEQIQSIVDKYYAAYNSLSNDQKALLAGDFSKVEKSTVYFSDETKKALAEATGKTNEEINKIILDAQKEYRTKLRETNEELVRLGLGNLSTFGKTFGDKETGIALADKTRDMGFQDARAYVRAWKEVAADNPELAKDLLNFDTSSLKGVVKTIQTMMEKGIDQTKIDNYWKSATSGANNFEIKLSDILSTAKAAQEELKGITDLGERMGKGEMTNEDVMQYLAHGGNIDNLMSTATGWKLVGESAEEALKRERAALLQEQEIELDILKQRKEDLSNAQSSDKKAEILGIDKENFIDEETGVLDWGAYMRAIQQATEELNNSIPVQKEVVAGLEAIQHTADENALLGNSDKAIRQAAMQEAVDAGLDTEELIAYSEKLQELYGLEQAMADRIALDNMKMNASIKELADNWDVWGEAIKEENKGTPEYSQALNSLRKNMSRMLGITDNLSDEFLTNADNMELMEKAAEGDADAIDALRKEAAKEIALGVDFDKDGIDQVESNLLTALEGFDPNIEIGTTLDEANLTQAFQELIDKGYASADDVNKALEGIGFEPEITTEEIPIDGSSAQRIVANGGFWKPTADMTGTEWVPIKNETELQGYVGQTATLPIINGKKTKYKGGSKSTVNGSNKKGGSGGKKGGGGKGGSKKQNNWKNPYDKYYNLTEKINEALRTREKIERDYDRILKRRERTVAELLANSQAEVGNLQKEIQYQKQLQAGRREQIQNVAGERYDNGDQITTFEKIGVTKYANYNFDTQTIEIDWAAIEAVRDEELGKAIEAYVSRLEELQGQFEETQDTIEEMEDQIWEINQRGKDEYLELEQKVINALINEQQKIIDDLNDKFEGINNANENILSSMQEQIDLERQIRDNTKTEDDIAQKEARLAYLRRDTSGANATEIMKLEQDLADARQNYTDTLIDQGMQKLSDENQKAAEQRQQQIDIMQAQLDWTAESGGFNQKAQELIDAAAKTGLTGSELEKLLQEDEGWAAMTTFAQTNWTEELTKSFKAAIEGMGNFKVEDLKTTATSSKNAEKMKDASGKNEASIWWDSSKGQWIDKDGNEYDVAYDAEKRYYYSNKRTPKKAEEPKTETPKTDSTPKTDTSTSDKDKPSPKTKKWYSKIKSKDGKLLKKLDNNGKGYNSQSEASTDAAKYLNNKRKTTLEQHQKNPRDPGLELAWLLWQYAMHNEGTFKTGGLADFTGPAWLDGTKAHPELVLNARDTENFIQLKDILSGMGSLDKLQNGGDNYYNFDIKVDQLASDYDVDKLIGKIKNEIDKDARYRNVNSINFIR